MRAFTASATRLAYQTSPQSSLARRHRDRMPRLDALEACSPRLHWTAGGAGPSLTYIHPLTHTHTNRTAGGSRMSIDKRFALSQTARFAVLDAPGGAFLIDN